MYRRRIVFQKIGIQVHGKGQFQLSLRVIRRKPASFTAAHSVIVGQILKEARAIRTEARLPRLDPMKLTYLFSLLAVGLVGCSSTRTTLVQVPPRMVLDRNKTIGIVRFDVE